MMLRFQTFRWKNFQCHRNSSRGTPLMEILQYNSAFSINFHSKMDSSTNMQSYLRVRWEKRVHTLVMACKTISIHINPYSLINRRLNQPTHKFYYQKVLKICGLTKYNKNTFKRDSGYETRLNTSKLSFFID